MKPASNASFLAIESYNAGVASIWLGFSSTPALHPALLGLADEDYFVRCQIGPDAQLRSVDLAERD